MCSVCCFIFISWFIFFLPRYVASFWYAEIFWFCRYGFIQSPNFFPSLLIHISRPLYNLPFSLNRPFYLQAHLSPSSSASHLTLPPFSLAPTLILPACLPALLPAPTSLSLLLPGHSPNYWAERGTSHSLNPISAAAF